MDIPAMTQERQPLQFPCSFPLKAVGANTNEFYAMVCAVIERHVGEGQKVHYHSRTSSGGKYLSVTVTFQAESREQLDDIYRDLNATGMVLMTL
jgi:putative lipoic acid-binding regulatory protein